MPYESYAVYGDKFEYPKNEEEIFSSFTEQDDLEGYINQSYRDYFSKSKGKYNGKIILSGD